MFFCQYKISPDDFQIASKSHLYESSHIKVSDTDDDTRGWSKISYRLTIELMINQSREIDELVSYGGEAKILPICPNISLDGLIWPTISPDEIFKEPLLTGIVLYRVHCVM